jgi:prepilin-type N-terminal cleavage/methylation domain-containing protein
MLSLMNRARARRAQGDEGFTLAESLVAMIVFGIAIAMVYTALVKVQKYTSDVQGSADANFELRQAVAVIDRQVRSGNVLYSPANETSPSSCTATGTDAGTCMRVYTQANGAQRCVQWQVINDPARPGTQKLRSRSWSTTWQTDGGYTGWQTDARNLLANPSTPPFTLQGAVNAYSKRYLVVRFEAKDPRRGNSPAVITDALAGRNTNYGYDSGLCNPAPPAS